MRRPERRQKAVVACLSPGEAAALLETLSSGYREAKEAAQRAFSPRERQARRQLARDLGRLTLHERAASRHIHTRAPDRQWGRDAEGEGWTLVRATGDPSDREAGE